MQSSKLFSLIIASLCYVITIPMASYFTAKYFSEYDYVLQIAFWDFCETTLLYGLAFALNSVCIIDFYWKIAPLIQISFLALQRYRSGDLHFKHLVSFLLMSTWGIRLLYNYIRSWPGLKFLDFRVKHYQDKIPQLLFWPAAFVIFFLVSGVFLFLGKLPLLMFMIESDDVFQFEICVGWFFIGLGIFIETLADYQLYAFRKKGLRNVILDEGLWFYCRHPNYTGELLVWWGVFLSGIEIFYMYKWTIIGAVMLSVMFAFGSAPWMDEHLGEKRKDYKEYMKKNRGSIIPWFRTKEKKIN